MLLPRFPFYHYKAIVTEVTDGDTIKAVVDCGFRVKVSHVFRLADIDTPEIFRPKNEKELQHGIEAKEYLSSLVLDNEVCLDSFKSRAGIYNRWDARIYIIDSDGDFQNVSELLRDNGFEKRESYE